MSNSPVFSLLLNALMEGADLQSYDNEFQIFGALTENAFVAIVKDIFISRNRS
jgi:hypothetical protein